MKNPENKYFSRAGRKFSAGDSVHQYLEEIGKFPLLSAEEERTLAEQIQCGTEAYQRLQIEEETLSEQEKIELQRLVTIGKQSKQRLTESNLRLVVSVARRYVEKGFAFSDLIQEGNLGLMKAVEKFDPSKGWRFSTCATWWIRQTISRTVINQGRNIRIPRHMTQIIGQIVRVSRQLASELNREPQPEEIAQAMNLPVEKVEYALEVMQETISLEIPVGENSDAVLGDFVLDMDAVNPETSIFNLELREQLGQVLRTLSPREEKVLWLRFGLEDGRSHTLGQIGKEFGLTKERIRQIEADALRKLNLPSRSKKLKDFWKG